MAMAWPLWADAEPEGLTEGDALGRPELTAVWDEVTMEEDAAELDGVTELTANAESARWRSPEAVTELAAAGDEVVMEDKATEPDGITELTAELKGLLVALEVAKPELTADGLLLSELPPVAAGTPQT